MTGKLGIPPKFDLSNVMPNILSELLIHSGYWYTVVFRKHLLKYKTCANNRIMTNSNQYCL